MLRLVVFLGNPGVQYENNRHNAGRLLAEKLPLCGGLSWQKKFKARYAPLSRGSLPAGVDTGDRIHFIIPETFMNLSGQAVQKAAAFLKITAPQIIVIHDELELPPGTVSLKYSGGLGGHNGLRSIREELGTADFWRLRIGIGRPAGRLPGEGGPPGSGGDVAGWVLSDFAAAEEPFLEASLNAAAALLVSALEQEPETLLDEWKKKNVL
jgi:PTH1 family peptidyl-tRNA hydrolase